jgi:hypothetical protein
VRFRTVASRLAGEASADHNFLGKARLFPAVEAAPGLELTFLLVGEEKKPGVHVTISSGVVGRDEISRGALSERGVVGTDGADTNVKSTLDLDDGD